VAFRRPRLGSALGDEMKFRRFVAPIAILIISLCAIFEAAGDRIPWVVISLLCFGGILVFDAYEQVTTRWMNLVVFIAVYGLIVGAVLANSAEMFWRDFAGTIFLISLLFEQNASPWSGFGPLRTTVTAAIILLLVVLAQSIPYLPAETAYSLSLGAIIISSYIELFCIFRENTAFNAGSFMTALRIACVGIGSLFYASVFLPEIARQAPFNLMFVALPVIAVAASLFAIFLKHWRRRQILFCCNWSLFIFWASITGEKGRFFAALGALVAGVWSVMMTDRNEATASQPWDLYLKLSAWGLPGSLLFTMIVFVLSPSTDVLVGQGSALWLISFFIFWSGLRGFKFSPEEKNKETSFTWRSRLAVVVTLFGASLLAGARILPNLLSEIWTQGWVVK
jgi:hypothetical protein